jgi:hypothetical protein
MPAPTQTERYIRFQLEQLSPLNEHHTFEKISFHIAERRLSSNLLLTTGPVSGGGDQGRDAESYRTSLPVELPGAGGFVGRATTEPLVVAASIQRDGLESKIKADLKSICGQGEPVTRVAFFAVHDISGAIQHRVKEHARETYDVGLVIFDGQAVAHALTQGDLVWVAQRYLELPSHLVPDEPGEPRPEWYIDRLAALRNREHRWLTLGTLAEVRDGLRHATLDDEARVDLPEWLRYMREFVDHGDDAELVFRARFECATATLRGMNTLDGAEDDIRAAIEHALASNRPSILEDATALLMYWGGAWSRHMGAISPEELRAYNLRMRTRLVSLLDGTDDSTHPVRAARLLDVLATLCLHPRWTEVERPPAGTLPTPRESTLLRRAWQEAGEAIAVDTGGVLLDVDEAMGYLGRLSGLLPRARAFPLGTLSQVFQMFAPVLADDPRYETEAHRPRGDRCSRRHDRHGHVHRWRPASVAGQEGRVGCPYPRCRTGAGDDGVRADEGRLPGPRGGGLSPDHRTQGRKGARAQGRNQHRVQPGVRHRHPRTDHPRCPRPPGEDDSAGRHRDPNRPWVRHGPRGRDPVRDDHHRCQRQTGPHLRRCPRAHHVDEDGQPGCRAAGDLDQLRP